MTQFFREWKDLCAKQHAPDEAAVDESGRAADHVDDTPASAASSASATARDTQVNGASAASTPPRQARLGVQPGVSSPGVLAPVAMAPHPPTAGALGPVPPSVHTPPRKVETEEVGIPKLRRPAPTSASASPGGGGGGGGGAAASESGPAVGLTPRRRRRRGSVRVRGDDNGFWVIADAHGLIDLALRKRVTTQELMDLEAEFAISALRARMAKTGAVRCVVCGVASVRDVPRSAVRVCVGAHVVTRRPLSFFLLFACVGGCVPLGVSCTVCAQPRATSCSHRCCRRPPRWPTAGRLWSAACRTHQCRPSPHGLRPTPQPPTQRLERRRRRSLARPKPLPSSHPRTRDPTATARLVVQQAPSVWLLTSRHMGC